MSNVEMRPLIICLCFVLLAFSSESQFIQVTTSPANEYHPKWSPDGEGIAFTKRTDSTVGIYVTPVHQFNEKQMPVKHTGDLAFSWSPDGTKIVFDAYPANQPPSNIYIYHLNDSKIVTLTDMAGTENHPTWSPDGSQIAFTSSDIWTIASTGGVPARVTTHAADEWHPAWSPDGTQIVFTSDQSGNHDLWIVSLSDGSTQQLTKDAARDDRACWSPDGSSIAFASDRSGNFDIWIIKLEDRTLKQITHHPAFDSHPDWSPDGKKIAFASQRSGNFDVWIKAIKE